MTPPVRRLLAGVSALAATLLAPSDARADDGPWRALGNMMDASPTLTIVTTSVVLLTDASLTTLDLVDALQARSADRGVYAVQTIVAAPQALGFSLAPFYFDIDRWSPAENLALLLPAQAWSAALTTHGAWSLSRPSFDPVSRLGVSFLVGVDTAFSTTALGCAFRDRWVPLEVGIAELSSSAVQLGLAIERGIDDPAHSAEWASLGAWSTVLATHGALSIALGDAHDDGDAPPSSARNADAVRAAPFVTPSPGGLVVGATGIF